MKLLEVACEMVNLDSLQDWGGSKQGELEFGWLGNQDVQKNCLLLYVSHAKQKKQQSLSSLFFFFILFLFDPI